MVYQKLPVVTVVVATMVVVEVVQWKWEELEQKSNGSHDDGNGDGITL